MGRGERAEQKLSLELAELAAPEARRPHRPRDADPDRHQSLRGRRDGAFRQQLEAAGAALGEYDADLQSYRAVATGPAIEKIGALDFVLFVELIGRTSPATTRARR